MGQKADFSHNLNFDVPTDALSLKALNNPHYIYFGITPKNHLFFGTGIRFCHPRDKANLMGFEIKVNFLNIVRFLSGFEKFSKIRLYGTFFTTI